MIYIVSIFIVLISYYQFKIIAGSMALNRLNMMSIIFYFYFIFVSYVGATFIANGYGYNPVLNYVSEDKRMFGWLAISYVIIAFPFGALIAKYIFNIQDVNKLFNKYVGKKLEPSISQKDSYMKLLMYFLSIICVISVIYMILITGSIPQAKFFSLQDQAEVLLLRNSINRNFEGIYFIKSVLFEKLTPLLSFISFSYYKMTGLKKDKIWFNFMFLLTIFVYTFTLSKSPLVTYGITFVILKIYLEGHIKWKSFLFFSLIAVLGIIFLFFLIVKNGEISFIFNYLFNRIFFDQISGTFLMFEIFPNRHNFIGFSSLSKPISNLLLGGYSEPAARIAMEYAFPIASEKGIMNLLSTLFIGEAWANFGWAGLIFSPIYLGFIIGLIYYIFLSLKKSPILVSFLAYCSFGVSISSEFNSYIYNSVMFAIVFIFSGVYLYALILKQIRGF